MVSSAVRRAPRQLASVLVDFPPKANNVRAASADMKQLNRVLEEIGSTVLLLVRSMSTSDASHASGSFHRAMLLDRLHDAAIVAILSFFIVACLHCKPATRCKTSEPSSLSAARRPVMARELVR